MQGLTLHRLVLPDSWQAEAIQALKQGLDVVLDAPTGAGKTYVFEKWIESSPPSGQAVYTVPTRALANDKYHEWKARGWKVGIRTGDLHLDDDAPVVVATLEAVQSAAEPGHHPSLFVVDEYQWLSDPVRGNHYEGVLMNLPPTVRLLLLSGSVANPHDAASWLERLGRRVSVIRHPTRPVPLEEVDLEHLARSVPRQITGFWPRLLTAALREDLAPVLVFAPRRQDAERLARQAAAALPPCPPLRLTPEQQSLVTPELARTLAARVAYHHSGLTYGQRAGVIEPLAKAGQLRVVVATLGLSAGINFSLRSVLLAGNRYMSGGVEKDLEPHEILQMAGRAGRRGLDETGFFLVTSQSPRLSHARPQQLKRAPAIPWAFLLRRFQQGGDLTELALRFGGRLFSETRLRTGIEDTSRLDPALLPCGQRTDTGRARLVRKTRRIFKGCKTCPLHAACLELDPQPTLIWQWQRLGIVDHRLQLTRRGQIVAGFLGPEGLALAAALEDPSYPVDELIVDLGNLYGSDRFCGSEPRWAGRLALACQSVYGRFTIPGFLEFGVPIQYGSGAAEIITGLAERDQRKTRLTGEWAGLGDIDRLLVEWRGLLRQIVSAPGPDWDRWKQLQEAARSRLATFPDDPLPVLPRLGPHQKEPISHKLGRFTPSF